MPVVAAVVRRDGAYLVARRPRGKRHGGLWEFPGGKIRNGEDDRAALARELREELDVAVDDVGEVLFVARDPGSRFVIRFRAVDVDGEPRSLEHEEVRWVESSRLDQLDLAPADLRFVRSCLAPE